jgi:hypothetical protein
MSWISTKDNLPEEGKYVLARHNLGTLIDRGDQENVNCVVVKLVKGISKAERKSLPDNDPRKTHYTSADEHGNNLVPYYWATFGSDSFFGQTITHWMPIEPITY